MKTRTGRRRHILLGAIAGAVVMAAAGTCVANAHEVVPTATQWFVQGIALCADPTP